MFKEPDLHGSFKSENRPLWFKVTNYGTSSPEAQRALSLWRHVIGIRRFFEYSAANRNGSRFLRREKRAGEREKETHYPGITRVLFLAKRKLAG